MKIFSAERNICRHPGQENKPCYRKIQKLPYKIYPHLKIYKENMIDNNCTYGYPPHPVDPFFPHHKKYYISSMKIPCDPIPILLGFAARYRTVLGEKADKH